MVAFNAYMHAEGSQLKANENIYTYRFVLEKVIKNKSSTRNILLVVAVYFWHTFNVVINVGHGVHLLYKKIPP